MITNPSFEDILDFYRNTILVRFFFGNFGENHCFDILKYYKAFIRTDPSVFSCKRIQKFEGLEENNVVDFLKLTSHSYLHRSTTTNLAERSNRKGNLLISFHKYL